MKIGAIDRGIGSNQEKMLSEVIQDVVFGPLAYNVRDGYWEGQVDLPSGQALEVTLEPCDETLESFLPAAREAFAHLCQREQEIHVGILSDLLRMYNDDWRDEEEDDPEPISGEEFIRRIQQRPALLQLNAPLTQKYSRTLYYEDGNLFGGHTIEVNLDPQNNVVSAGIVG